MAGMESSANSRSVVPSARMTTSIGVTTLDPALRTVSRGPWNSLVAGKRCSIQRRNRFSSNSSSSLSPSRASLTAV